MSGFVAYILKHNGEDSPWGDVAMDFAHEACEVQHGWGYKKVKAHLEEMGACDRVMVILDEMWYAYKHRSAPLAEASIRKDTRRV